MALFKKLKHSSKSTTDLNQFVDESPAPPVSALPRPTTATAGLHTETRQQARASKSTDNLRTFISQTPTPPKTTSPSTAPPSPAPRKAWVPKQKNLLPQPSIPYRHVPTHAATDAFRTLQGKGGPISFAASNSSNYWQNLGVYPRGGRGSGMKRSQSSSEISTGSIDSVLCSCAAIKSDDGYYHPVLAQEMRHCCHSPVRKGKASSSSGRGSMPSTASTTPASSLYTPDTITRPSSLKDASALGYSASTSKLPKSVTFSDALLNRLEEETAALSADVTEPLPPVPRPVSFALPSDDDTSTDSGLPSIPEVEVVVAERELENEEDKADEETRKQEVVYTAEYLDRMVLGPMVDTPPVTSPAG